MENHDNENPNTPRIEVVSIPGLPLFFLRMVTPGQAPVAMFVSIPPNLRMMMMQEEEEEEANLDVPIPEAMKAECEARVGDKCMICLEEFTAEVVEQTAEAMDDEVVAEQTETYEAVEQTEINAETVEQAEGDQAKTSSPPWISLLTCRHRFHAHCISQWMRPHCPVCRADYSGVE